jgi:cytidylate kinase
MISGRPGNHCQSPQKNEHEHEHEHDQVIAIDGPAAAGKSTVARLLADRIGALLFDTGALYRAISLLALRAGVAPEDASALSDIAHHARIHIQPASIRDGRQFDVIIGGEDVTWALREPGVGEIVSRVSEHPEVRDALLPLQRAIAASGPVVMVGRDIGSVVVPDAGLKIYLDASLEERATRRFRESQARGMEVTYGDVLEETRQRDTTDSSRDTAPLRAAPDAIRIETDLLEIDEVVDLIDALRRERLAAARHC